MKKLEMGPSGEVSLEEQSLIAGMAGRMALYCEFIDGRLPQATGKTKKELRRMRKHAADAFEALFELLP